MHSLFGDFMHCLVIHSVGMTHSKTEHRDDGILHLGREETCLSSCSIQEFSCNKHFSQIPWQVVPRALNLTFLQIILRVYDVPSQRSEK